MVFVWFETDRQPNTTLLKQTQSFWVLATHLILTLWLSARYIAKYNTAIDFVLKNIQYKCSNFHYSGSVGTLPWGVDMHVVGNMEVQLLY